MSPFTPNFDSHKQVEAYPIAAAEFWVTGPARSRSRTARSSLSRLASRRAARPPLATCWCGTSRPSRSRTATSRTRRGRFFDAGYAPLSRRPDSKGEPALSLAETQAVVETKTAPRVTEASIKAKIADVEYFRVRHLTICVITLHSGFFVTGESARPRRRTTTGRSASGTPTRTRSGSSGRWRATSCASNSLCARRKPAARTTRSGRLTMAAASPIPALADRVSAIWDAALARCSEVSGVDTPAARSETLNLLGWPRTGCGCAGPCR